jgi:hypothetical protein
MHFEHNYTNFTNENKFSIPLINEFEIAKLIDGISTKKSCASDNISGKFIKSFKFTYKFIQHINLLFNLSINKSKVPTLWKVSKIIPIHKSGNINLQSNYRPISLLPIISKLLEKHVFNNLYDFMSENNLLSQNQFGFKRNNSTVDALLRIKHCVSDSLNRSLKCALVTIDLKKA